MRIVLFALLFLSAGIAQANEPRNILQSHTNVAQLKEYLLATGKWVKYPVYTNRSGWDALFADNKTGIIKKGEEQLNYVWKVVKATDYLEYERSGNRQAMEKPMGANTNALVAMMLAELAEGKGRFTDQIINGVWSTCDMVSWALSAHLTVQRSKRSLPDPAEQIIDLRSGEVGSLLSWGYYFFSREWDKVNPVIAARVKQTIRERILAPYMQRSDYWWQALQEKPGQLVNNWNPWCNFNVLTCFLLVENNKDSLATAVYRTMQSVDKFMNYVKEDGACEEGPSYWEHAAGKLYDYLQLLSYATGNRVNIFDNPMVRKMGEYISRSYVGNDWVVNFADASAKGGGNPGLIYRYGKAVQSNEMMSFGAWLAKNGHAENLQSGGDFFRSLENIFYNKELLQATPSLSNAAFTWYPQTEVLFMKSGNWFLGAKGGFNNESHNHNDVGSFVLYANEEPVLVDVGVGTYTRQTFSNERYTIWTMQSNYHNLPLINGQPQIYGTQYRASEVKFDGTRKQFSLDITKAYGDAAAMKKWVRNFTLTEQGLTIQEDFELKQLKDTTAAVFMSWAAPDISKPGSIVLQKKGANTVLQYDAALFAARVDTIEQTDTRLSNVWGNALYRIVLTVKKPVLKGKYVFTVKKS
ncbi:MAG: heparinase II/III family protein [Chitinophagaceae bacterium]